LKLELVEGLITTMHRKKKKAQQPYWFSYAICITF
jgi:hypothetical protein